MEVLQNKDILFLMILNFLDVDNKLAEDKQKLADEEKQMEVRKWTKTDLLFERKLPFVQQQENKTRNRNRLPGPWETFRILFLELNLHA